MDTTSSYFVVKKKAVPEVLLKVVEAKRLLETGRAASIHEATDISPVAGSTWTLTLSDAIPLIGML